MLVVIFIYLTTMIRRPEPEYALRCAMSNEQTRRTANERLQTHDKQANKRLTDHKIVQQGSKMSTEN